MDMGIFARMAHRISYQATLQASVREEGRGYDKWVKRALNVCSVTKVLNVSLGLWSVSVFAAMSQCNQLQYTAPQRVILSTVALWLFAGMSCWGDREALYESRVNISLRHVAVREIFVR